MTGSPNYGKFIGFPIKALGLTGLAILFLLAATSHDFWLAFLTPRVWKALHMALYLAYGVLVMHVALGVMQEDRRAFIPMLLGGSFAAGHAVASRRRLARARDRAGWRMTAGHRRPRREAIPDKARASSRRRTASASRCSATARQIGALTNVCAHQNGPIGEGRIINGCVTCPWHGYEYRLADGCAPPPFTEKLATYRVRIRDGIVEVDPNALPPGTPAAITLGEWRIANSE